MKTVRDVVDLKDKKVLLRADFDVAVDDGKIVESFRILKQKKMIDWLIEKGARIVMIAHLGEKGESFGDLVPQLHMILGHEFGFVKQIEQLQNLDQLERISLLENIRTFPGELENSEEFAKKLASNFDLYINNDFAVCHRNQASVSVIIRFLPSYTGFLIEEEVSQLEKVINAPSEGKVLIIGGAKASTKIPVIKNLIDKCDKVLVGGVVANDILKAKGVDVKNSVVDENLSELLSGLDLNPERSREGSSRTKQDAEQVRGFVRDSQRASASYGINNPKLILPEDYVWSENKILDIGLNTVNRYKEIISSAKMIIWNGPMGMFENPDFANGTNALAQSVIESSAYKIAGGGDTISALDKLHIIGKFDFVSTGGGAMLAFLAGEKLPGLEALDYYKF